MTTLTDLIYRGDDDLTAWAIEWCGVDIAAEWPALDDDQRDALVTAGVVTEVQAGVECTDAESWESDWRTESNAAWPMYTLTVSADDMDDIDVKGWHLVGPMGPDGNRRYEEWATEDEDGQGYGRPYVDGWQIISGDHVGSDAMIPCWRDDSGQWCTLDRDHLGYRRDWQGALADAASDADHGDEPTWDDVERDEMTTHDDLWIIRDAEIVEVSTLTGGIAGRDVEYQTRLGQWRDTVEYYATAWSHSLTDDTYQDEGDALSALSEMVDDGKTYDSEDAALLALSRMALDAHDEPDGIECGIDDTSLYAQPADDGDDARYHLDADQCTRVIRYGWMAVMPDIIEALGIRATLDGARQWVSEMDRIISEADPYVSVDDSLTAGNCRAETDRMRQRLCDDCGGTVGAVRASVILSLRDDAYTRRACRVAAQRVMMHRQHMLDER
jgi:hypothetical protein